MTPTDEIEPLVPELPREMLADGGEQHNHRRTPRPSRKTFADPEAHAPLVPDVS